MSEQNIYGLSEGVFQACLFMGLKFPPNVPEEFATQEHVPSDYFGDNFILNSSMRKKLCTIRKWSSKNFFSNYKKFSLHFYSQPSLRYTQMDLNVYFCDYILSTKEGLQNFSIDNYFSFEFYRKSFKIRDTFITNEYQLHIRRTCNDNSFLQLAGDKSETNKIFADFLHRDWISTRDCTFSDFKAFVNKYPRFFSKPLTGSLGDMTEIINIDTNANLENLFADLKSKKKILEEIVTQNEELAAFCPDSVNTIRVYTILDIHNVTHILTTVGRFGRVGEIRDNFSKEAH